jgi:hypothetical protein
MANGLGGGTAPAGVNFGANPKTSVTNKWAQTHDVANLYICDASVFPSCADKTTMPIVAFAMRSRKPSGLRGRPELQFVVACKTAK